MVCAVPIRCERFRAKPAGKGSFASMSPNMIMQSCSVIKRSTTMGAVISPSWTLFLNCLLLEAASSCDSWRLVNFHIESLRRMKGRNSGWVPRHHDFSWIWIVESIKGIEWNWLSTRVLHLKDIRIDINKSTYLIRRLSVWRRMRRIFRSLRIPLFEVCRSLGKSLVLSLIFRHWCLWLRSFLLWL